MVDGCEQRDQQRNNDDVENQRPRHAARAADWLGAPSRCLSSRHHALGSGAAVGLWIKQGIRQDEVVMVNRTGARGPDLPAAVFFGGR
jgi:hypothetical protein